MLRRGARRACALAAGSRAHAFSTASAAPAASPAGQTAGRVVFAGLTALTTGLGVWQLVRYNWKLGVIADSQGALEGEELDITAGASTDAAVEARPGTLTRVRVSGEFLPVPPVRVSPRTPPPGLPPYLSSLSPAHSGYVAVQPLRRDDGSTVLVLRGWSPADAPSPPLPTGRVTVRGVAREGEAGGVFSVRGASAARDGQAVLSLLDAEALGAAAGLPPGPSPPLLVEAVSPWPARGEVGRGVPPWPVTRQWGDLGGASSTALPPSTHLFYAATWFSLALCGAVITRRRFGGVGGVGGRDRSARRAPVATG